MNVGIWVKAQDGKELISIIGMRVYENNIWAVGVEEEIEGLLGCYDSDDEAKQVLDMLKRRICNGLADVGVFMMPEAGFSQKFYPDCGADLNHCGLMDKEIDPLADRCSGYADCKAAWERGCR